MLKNLFKKNINNNQKSSQALPMFALSYVFIILGYSFNNGWYYGPPQVFLILIGWFLLIIPFFSQKSDIFKNFKNIENVKILAAIGFINFIIFYFFADGAYAITNSNYINAFGLVKFFILLLSFFYFINFSLKGSNFFSAVFLHLDKNKFKYLVISALILQLLVIFGSPVPLVDVYWILDGGAKAFNNFLNPYSVSYPLPYMGQNYEIDSAGYLPISILIPALAKYFFGDVRYAIIITEFFAAWLLYLLMKKHNIGNAITRQLIVLLFLYIPQIPQVVEAAWIETISLLFYYAFIFLALSGFSYLPYIALAFFIGTKQTFVVFLPFLFLYEHINLKKIILLLSIFVLIIAPFLFWNVSDFFYDIFTFHVNRINELMHSLSLDVVVHQYFSFYIPLYIIFPLLILLFLFLMLNSPRDLKGIIHSTTVFLLAIFMLKRGYSNYLYFISGSIIILMVLDIFEQNRHQANS